MFDYFRIKISNALTLEILYSLEVLTHFFTAADRFILLLSDYCFDWSFWVN